METDPHVTSLLNADSPADENVRVAIDKIDDTLDRAFGSAADTMWNFASALSVGVSSVVKDGPGRFSQNIAPLDTLGRSWTDKITNFGPDERSLAKLKDAALSAAETVQRQASAVEGAFLATAAETLPPFREPSNVDNGDTSRDDEPSSNEHYRSAEGAVRDRSTANSVDEQNDGENFDISTSSSSATNARGYMREDLDVNKELVRAAETIQKSIVGQTVGGLFNSLWATTGEYGEDEMGGHSASIPDAPVTRLQRLVLEMETNPDTYCQAVSDTEAFNGWLKDFNLDKHEKQCIALLSRHEPIAELYERVVPEIIEEDIFWGRYFFALHTIDEEEKGRLKLLQRAVGSATAASEPEASWDDDWDNEEDAEDDAKNINDEANATTTKGGGKPVDDASIVQTAHSDANGEENAGTRKPELVDSVPASGERSKASSNGLIDEKPSSDIESKNVGSMSAEGNVISSSTKFSLSSEKKDLQEVDHGLSRKPRHTNANIDGTTPAVAMNEDDEDDWE